MSRYWRKKPFFTCAWRYLPQGLWAFSISLCELCDLVVELGDGVHVAELLGLVALVPEETVWAYAGATQALTNRTRHPFRRKYPRSPSRPRPTAHPRIGAASTQRSPSMMMPAQKCGAVTW